MVVSQQKFLFQTRSFLISNNSAYASMKKAKYFVYVLMEWMGAEEKMVGLKKYEMWWGSC